MSKTPKAPPQVCKACESCGREIVTMSGHQKCPWCGWAQAVVGKTPKDTGMAYKRKVKGRGVPKTI